MTGRSTTPCEYFPDVGEHVQDAVAVMRAVAVSYGAVVVCGFNHTALIVDAHTNIFHVWDYYVSPQAYSNQLRRIGPRLKSRMSDKEWQVECDVQKAPGGPFYDDPQFVGKMMNTQAQRK